MTGKILVKYHDEALIVFLESSELQLYREIFSLVTIRTEKQKGNFGCPLAPCSNLLEDIFIMIERVGDSLRLSRPFGGYHDII